MNTWFRMYHEFATDPKVQMLSEIDQRRFVMLLCLRCSNSEVTLHDDQVAFQLRISNEEYAKTKGELIASRLINSDNTPVAWDKRQYVSDSSAARVAAHRKRKKQQCNVTSNDNETKRNAPDTDTDTDTDTEKKKKGARKRAVYVPPDWMPIDLWSAYLNSRKQKRHPMNAESLELCVEALQKVTEAGIPIETAMKRMIEAGWRSCKLEWFQSGPVAAAGIDHKGNAAALAEKLIQQNQVKVINP